MRTRAEEPRDGDALAGGAGLPKAMLFDLGGVFIDWDPRNLYRKLFAGDVAAMEYFLAKVCTPAWHEEQDRGKGIAEACAELAASHPAYARFISAWAERNEEMVGGVLEGSIAVLAELKAEGVPCYALSNMERESWAWRLEHYEFLRWFDGYVISGLEGVAKPDREIFEIALERFKLAPPEVMFVDDRPLNVEAAARLGIRAVLFSTPEAMRELMVMAGLLRAARRLGEAGSSQLCSSQLCSSQLCSSQLRSSQLGLGRPQAEGEGATCRAVEGTDGPTVRLHQAAGDGEAEPSAAVAWGPRRVSPVASVEHVLEDSHRGYRRTRRARSRSPNPRLSAARPGPGLRRACGAPRCRGGCAQLA